MEYSEKMHAHRLRMMLEHESVCSLCPASRGFNGDGLDFSIWSTPLSQIHQICSDFVGIPRGAQMTGTQCPCHYFKSERKAREASYKALERFERRKKS